MTQKVAASPQMALALEIMQLPVQELALRLVEELDRNPVLVPEDEALLIEEEQESGDLTEESLVADSLEHEPEEDVVDALSLRFDDDNYLALQSVDPELDELFTLDDVSTRRLPLLEELLASTPSLVELMLERADGHFFDKTDLAMAEILIGEMDESGLISVPLGEITETKGWDPAQLERVLRELQRIGPTGVCARSTQECLLLQLEDEGLGHSLAYRLVRDSFDDLLHNRLGSVQKQLHLTSDQIHAAIQEDLNRLGLHSSMPQPEFAPTLLPDIQVSEVDTYLVADVVTDPLPSPRFDPRYRAMMDEGTPETVAYLHQCLRQGKWMLMCVEQRNRLLKRIGDLLVDRMSHYLRGETAHLIPIPLHAAAQALHVHESTVIRAIAGKTLMCPGGTLPLSKLFTHAYVTPDESPAKVAIRELVEKENRFRPLSDEQLAQLLNEQGIPCARRTVAKYRVAMRIPNTRVRRQH
jgi:RNA polymerase sigma-54 factor